MELDYQSVIWWIEIDGIEVVGLDWIDRGRVG